MNPSFALRNVYTDHMVFQRGMPIRVAGTAPAETHVTVRFASDMAQTVQADSEGRWNVSFAAREAGGPYELSVMDYLGARILLKDIYVGEVWLCSGQSNMEFLVRGAKYYSLPDGETVAANANDSKLRLFQVQHGIGANGPIDNIPQGTSWLPANTPDAVGPFSAVGYWFGTYLREALGEDVAVGIIHASWGGSAIESWLVPDGLEMKSWQDYVEKSRADFEKWIKAYKAYDPAATQAALANWAKPGLDLSDWHCGPFAELKEAIPEGVSWYRHDFVIPASWAGKTVTVHMDAVSDCDETFIDGVQIGAISVDTDSYWSAPRDYTIPASFATPGKHTLAVRISNHYCQGGILGAATLRAEGETETIDLKAGEWAARAEFQIEKGKLDPRPEVIWFHKAGLEGPGVHRMYNAMIHPFTAMAVRGFAWYQGCSNTYNPDRYRETHPHLIDSWRKMFQCPDAAFLVTQLSAFEQHNPEKRLPDDYWKSLLPHDGGYPRVREVQDQLRSIPNVGVAVTIDIGDHSDIHPSNKKDVAYRLAMQARRICYGYTGVSEGPRFATKEVEGSKIRLQFSNVGGGLITKGGDAIGEHSFAIAGADGQYHWAEARREGNTVVVWNDDVREPLHVRYAWGNFPPNPNLYNAEGFPLYPFRTDNW